MNRHRRLIFMIALVFFLLGVSWGIFSDHDLFSGRAKPVLTIICPKAWVPTSVINTIAYQLGVSAVQADYDSITDFVRLAANAQGEADVLCFHSFLAKDLIASKFISQEHMQGLSQFSHVSPDFLKTPFDPDFSYTVPLFWGVNGFVVHGHAPDSWQALWPQHAQKVALLYPDLELVWRMEVSGLEIHDDETPAESKKRQDFVQSFLKLAPTFSANQEPSADKLERFPYFQMASGPAAVFLKNHPDWKYWLPEDGVSLWFALAGVGIHTRYPDKARAFINLLISPEIARRLHSASQNAAVQTSLDDDPAFLAMQKNNFMRSIPLNRLRFPDLTLESIPQLERLIQDKSNQD